MNKSLKGIMGAVISSSFLIIIWVTLYQFGYIALLVSLLLYIFTLKGYEFFCKYGNGERVCIYIDCIMIFIATYLSYGIAVYNQVQDYNMNLFESVRTLSIILGRVEILKVAFIYELLFAYLLMFIGVYVTNKYIKIIKYN